MIRRKHRKVHTVFSVNEERTWNDKKMTYRTKFIDSIRYLVWSLSNISDNLAEEFYNGKWKYFKYCLEYIRVTFADVNYNH